MPLLGKKPFGLVEPPNDLDPNEPVYQIRFTKEVMRDYQVYLNRLNMYRDRIWTCKSTGRKNLTFEEALLSEKCATEKVQALPKELVKQALRIIQYSMLPLKDLADAISSKLQDCLFVDAEMHGVKDGDLRPCKILRILEDSKEYEVGWLDRNRKISGKTLISGGDLKWKKFPFSKEFLKSFIRESTSRSIPWVLHENLAQTHGISTELPMELQSKYFFQDDGQLTFRTKRKKTENNGKDMEMNEESGKFKKKKSENGSLEEDDQVEQKPIQYPIEDLLVQPAPDDPVFTDRPSPSRDFNVPMDCVGDLLMVWDFCSCFSKQLHLLPFPLEDFEKAICYKDSNLVLIGEVHAALFRFLIKDYGEYFLAVQKKSQKLKITLLKWTEYLCEFLEVIDIPELSLHLSTIKRGYYGHLDVNVKLGILRELVSQVVETDPFREMLDELIEERHAIGATRREEALEEGRKRREHKEKLKAGAVTKGATDANTSEDDELANGKHHKEIGGVKSNGVLIISEQNGMSDERRLENGVKNSIKKESVEVKLKAETGKDSLAKKSSRDDKEGTGRTAEQRRQYYEREMEKRVIRTNSLGKDRHYNRYWWFHRNERIFVESSDFQQWGYYSSKEELDALIGSLNCKGEREKALKQELEKFYDRICLKVQKKEKELARRVEVDESAVRRSSRVRAPPKENPANAFLRYVNKWKED